MASIKTKNPVRRSGQFASFTGYLSAPVTGQSSRRRGRYPKQFPPLIPTLTPLTRDAEKHALARQKSLMSQKVTRAPYDCQTSRLRSRQTTPLYWRACLSGWKPNGTLQAKTSPRIFASQP
jgi:hypothetical protein